MLQYQYQTSTKSKELKWNTGQFYNNEKNNQNVLFLAEIIRTRFIGEHKLADSFQPSSSTYVIHKGPPNTIHLTFPVY